MYSAVHVVLRWLMCVCVPVCVVAQCVRRVWVVCVYMQDMVDVIYHVSLIVAKCCLVLAAICVLVLYVLLYTPSTVRFIDVSVVHVPPNQLCVYVCMYIYV